MKRFILLSCLAAGMLRAGAQTAQTPQAAQNPQAPQTCEAHYRVSILSADNGVVIDRLPVWVQSARVYVGRTEIPSQLDDLDGDGRYDELAFVLERRGSVKVRVVYSTAAPTVTYPARVNAQMWLKQPDKTLREVRTAASLKDDMYRQLHHHGPAFESDKAAYRVYFDKKQSIDTYGKKRPGLELRQTMWYPTDEQLAEGSGHDNLRVFGSISVGVLKGWDAEKRKMLHITDMTRREATIRAAGPVRTVVDMRVEGWRYCGRTLTMTSRYILYAGHADVQVENRLEGDFQGLDFVTGVMKIKDGACDDTQSDRRQAILCSTGTDYPENDTVRWQPERVTLAVAVDRARVVGRAEDPTSHLLLVRPDAEGRLDYRMIMLWRKNTWLPERFWGDEWSAAAAGELRQLRRPVVRGLEWSDDDAR